MQCEPLVPPHPPPLPSVVPSLAPSTASPARPEETLAPSQAPSVSASLAPSASPSQPPSVVPSVVPSQAPSVVLRRSLAPHLDESARVQQRRSLHEDAVLLPAGYRADVAVRARLGQQPQRGVRGTCSKSH
jgi:hypothetical protein